jgi:hypothetical protein
MCGTPNPARARSTATANTLCIERLQGVRTDLFAVSLWAKFAEHGKAISINNLSIVDGGEGVFQGSNTFNSLGEFVYPFPTLGPTKADVA